MFHLADITFTKNIIGIYYAELNAKKMCQKHSK